MWELIDKTLIVGESYLVVLKGLQTTFMISLFSVLLGTILGVVICYMRTRHNVVIKTFAQIYIAVLRGSPVLLLLMLMYYVVFAKSTLSAPWIAVVAFGLNASAHTSECFRAAISATDPLQVEAARTLGFSKWQAFRLVSLPQTITIAKPTYQSTVVN